jgi:hypothetical protein
MCTWSTRFGGYEVGYEWMIFENVAQRVCWMTWCMDKCYGVDYINTTIKEAEPMIGYITSYSNNSIVI